MTEYVLYFRETGSLFEEERGPVFAADDDAAFALLVSYVGAALVLRAEPITHDKKSLTVVIGSVGAYRLREGVFRGTEISEEGLIERIMLDLKD